MVAPRREDTDHHHSIVLTKEGLSLFENMRGLSKRFVTELVNKSSYESLLGKLEVALLVFQKIPNRREASKGQPWYRLPNTKDGCLVTYTGPLWHPSVSPFRPSVDERFSHHRRQRREHGGADGPDRHLRRHQPLIGEGKKIRRVLYQSTREALTLDQSEATEEAKTSGACDKNHQTHEWGKRAQPQCARARGSTVRDVHNVIEKTRNKTMQGRPTDTDLGAKEEMHARVVCCWDLLW